jgi:hypothetical protein
VEVGTADLVLLWDSATAQRIGKQVLDALDSGLSDWQQYQAVRDLCAIKNSKLYTLNY